MFVCVCVCIWEPIVFLYKMILKTIVKSNVEESCRFLLVLSHGTLQVTLTWWTTSTYPETCQCRCSQWGCGVHHHLEISKVLMYCILQFLMWDKASSHGEIGRICRQGINAEFSQFDTERTVQRIRETKILFFETINKVDLCLAKLTER